MPGPVRLNGTWEFAVVAGSNDGAGRVLGKATAHATMRSTDHIPCKRTGHLDDAAPIHFEPRRTFAPVWQSSEGARILSDLNHFNRMRAGARRLADRMSSTFVAGLTAITFTSAAMAADGPPGIAFAYEPDGGFGVCTGPRMNVAMECAQKACSVSSNGWLRPQDCTPRAWCNPTGWSFTVAFMHEEGVHWSEISCGWPTKEAALAAAKVLCDTQYREGIEECLMGGLWDEDGTEIDVDEAV